jgi:GT2 family glycosyltransferase
MQPITFATNLGYNTLEHAKLLVRSLKENLDSDQHQILIFIDADNENALEYFLGIKDTFHDMTIIKNNMEVPVGYQRNKTLITEYAKYDFISYLQADMVVGPHYDTEILKHAKKGRILSATRVEPPLHGYSDVTFTKNFGLHPEEFNFADWNAYSESIKEDKIIPYFFAPITYHKDDWMALGGYDTLFRRSREDSDLVQRAMHLGIERVQTFSANVYHFTCVSSRGKNWFDGQNKEAQDRLGIQNQADSIELRRYTKKWGTFNHGQEKVFKLDMDLVVKNYSLNAVAQLEPFFSRVWLNTDEEKQILIREYETTFHTFANKLMNVSDEQWEKYKHLYRKEDLNEVFKVGTPDDYNILVEMDFNTLVQPNGLIDNRYNLYDLLHQYDPGVYELDGIRIDIKTVKVLDPGIHVQNPKFDYTLLTVYS